MSHAEQLGFVAACVEANRRLVDGAAVLEIGSYDVNGSVRRLFDSATRYVGVDLVAGPGVDLVIAGKDVDAPDGSFDVVLSGECFEHDADWRQTLRAMVRLTRPGGLVIFTCATRGRVEHGTRRTSAADSPGTQALGSDYYRNVDAQEVAVLPLSSWFSSHTLHYAPRAADLYFCGVRAGPNKILCGQLPDSDQVRALADLMPARERLLRAPLRLLARAVTDERRFQAVATRYWRAVVTGVRVKERALGPGRSR